MSLHIAQQVHDLADSAVTRDKASLPADILDEDFPLPAGSSRFILPMALRQALHKHPFSRDLYMGSAGFTRASMRSAPPAAPYFLVYYCVGGEMTLHTAGGDWPVVSGDLIVIPPELAHATDASTSGCCNYFWISYGGELSTAYTQFIGASDVVVHLGLHPELVAQFEALCNFRTSNFTLDAFINGANRLKVLLTSIAPILSQKTNRNKARINLDRIRKFMLERMASSLNLQELAKFVNLSPYHFARTFKELTGQTPMYYFTQLRLQQACHLLDTTRQPIGQVALAVGYSNPRYFSRIFHQTIGMTPRAYRNWSAPRDPFFNPEQVRKPRQALKECGKLKRGKGE